jgi:hypothetical protein
MCTVVTGDWCVVLKKVILNLMTVGILTTFYDQTSANKQSLSATNKRSVK